MGAPVLEKLHVLVTGIDAPISRDVVRLLASEGANVIAAAPNATSLARLERDLSLYRLKIDVAHLDLEQVSEVRLWEENLRVFGRLPHLVICCCNAPSGRGRSHRAATTPADVEINKTRSERCPAAIAERVLQPSLVLHAQPRRRSFVGRALSNLRHPTLPDLLEMRPGHGPFSPGARFPFVRIASGLYSLRRPLDPPATRTERAASPSPLSRRRRSADAA